MRKYTRYPRKLKKQATILTGLRNKTRKPSMGIVVFKTSLPPVEQARIAQELSRAIERHQGRFMIVASSLEHDVKFIPLPSVKKLHILNR